MVQNPLTEAERARGRELHLREATGETLTDDEVALVTRFRQAVQDEESARLRPLVEREEGLLAWKEQRNQELEALVAQREAEFHRLLTLLKNVPNDIQQRFDRLRDIQESRGLTPEEHAECLAVTERIEKFDAGRLVILSELATLRGVTLRQVFADLGLKPRRRNRKRG
jgi:hypothetical protein